MHVALNRVCYPATHEPLDHHAVGGPQSAKSSRPPEQCAIGEVYKRCKQSWRSGSFFTYLLRIRI